MVAQNECNNEECNAQEDSNAGDQMNEMVDFLCNWCFACVQTGCQTGNTSHNSVITAADDNTFGSAFDGICWEECQVLGFQWIFVSEFRATWLRFRFSSQRWIVNLELVQIVFCVNFCGEYSASDAREWVHHSHWVQMKIIADSVRSKNALVYFCFYTLHNNNKWPISSVIYQWSKWYRGCT